MNAAPPSANPNEEISLLIEVLHETEQRLEELTVGEVDSVASRDGRTFLLRRAQDRLRESEADKQAAILNALPAHIALLDTSGVIVSINNGWRQFGSENGFQPSAYGVGLNYLKICDRASGEGAVEAGLAASGIRSILTGRTKTYSLGYACHSPTQQRWFRLTASALLDKQSGVVVMHVDITAQRQADESLRVSELRFRQMAENIHDVFFLNDAVTNRVLYVSPAYKTIWGRSCESLYADPKAWIEAIHPDDRAAAYAQYENGAASAKFEFGYRIVRPDGSIRHIEARGFPVRDSDGTVVRMAGVATDVTDSVRAKAQATRLLTVLEASLNEIYICDADTLRFDYVNECARRNLGYSMDEMRKLTPVDLKPEYSPITFADLLVPLRRHKTPKIVFRTVHRRADDSRYPVEVHMQLVERGGKPVLLAVVTDITDRKRLEQSLQASEQHFHFLDDLANAVRPLFDPEQIMAVSSRMLGEHLRASRCAYADVESDSEQFTILHDYTDGCASTVGRYQLSLFGLRAVAALHSGQTLVIRDVKAELAKGEGADMFNAIGIEAIISCPLIKNGKLRAMMALHQTTPRDWTNSDVALVQEVVERCWAAIERRTAEERLKQSEALLRIAGRTAQMGGWAVNVAKQSVTWSDEVCSTLEVPLGTVPTLEQALSYYAPRSRGMVTQALDNCLKQGTPFDLELEMTTASGQAIWVRCAGEPQRNSAGTVIQAHGAFQDITERKHSEEALEQRLTELRVLFDLLPAMIWFKDTENRILRVNKHVADAAGKSIEEIEGRPSVEIYPQDSAKYFADDLEVITSGMPKLGIVETLRSPDGQEVWVQTDKVPVFDKDKKVLGVFVMAQDITQRKVTSRELRESERRFSDMLGNVQLASVMLNGEGQITYCNDYLLRLTGWQREEVMGQDWFELFVPPSSQNLKSVFAELLTDPPESWHRENEILTRSGERRLIRWNISLLRSGSGTVIGTASIGEDITDRKRAEIRIKHLNRVYSVLSGINTLIVRVHNRDELFKEACRIAVEIGGFRMSLIALLDSPSTKILTVASFGKDEALLKVISDALSSSEVASNTMIGQAMKQKKPVVANNSQSDTRLLFGDRYVASGVRSLAVLPLIVAGEAVGALALFAKEIDFFHEDEMKLLTELTGDIAFAIDYIQKGERLAYLAYYDSLTGLANRMLFHERLTQAVLNASEQDRKIALILLDVERFKAINDTLGRKTGDELLKELAGRLSANTISVERLARIEADHFAIMVTDLQTEEEVAQRIESRLEAVFGSPFLKGETELRMAGKLGIAMFPADGADAEALFRNAEAALKNAKTSNQRYLFYAHTMNERVAEKLAMENQLRRALENEEFVLHYQPKVNLATGKLTGCEALIRWNDPMTGLVPPGRFIPVLEETGLILQVGRWALRKAIQDYLRWRNAGLDAVRIAVNVSALQLRDRGFIDEIKQAIGIDKRAASGLELEITEGMIMEDVKYCIESLLAIRAMGVTIAIDDFGTGFSSLSYLSKLPIDTLKIDRSFVIDMTGGAADFSLVATIINLAHSLKMKVVAEGVETEEQARLLRFLNCDEMQGFLFSEPVSSNVFEAKFLGTPRA